MDYKKLEKNILDTLNNLDKAVISNKMKAEIISEEIKKMLQQEDRFYIIPGKDNEN